MKSNTFIKKITVFLFISILFSCVANKGWRESFDHTETLPDSWIVKGNVSIDRTENFKGTQSLALEKTEETLYNEVSVLSPSFAVTPGNWLLNYAAKSDLRSMDNSYKGSVFLEFFDHTGNAVEKMEVGALFGLNNWKLEEKQIEIPKSAVSARFYITIEKETVGKFWLDELAIFPVKENQAGTIKRMMFSTVQLGHMLYPDDPKEITVEVWATKPLSNSQRNLSIVLKDYWGAEQADPVKSVLELQEKKDDIYIYVTKVDLGSLPLEIGRYYEVHGYLRLKDGGEFTNYSSLVVLPEAEANRYKPEEIPWTNRTWDNRIVENAYLCHRLGVRICGIWGRMDPDPAKTEAPCLDVIEKLGMGFLTGAASSGIEQRRENWRDLLANDGAILRQSVRNFLEKFGHVQPIIINLGNEPHTKGEEVKSNVEAYRIVYEEVKKINPAIYVVGTSIGPNEDFAKYGFGKWCDAYDFHVYEDALSVREMIEERYPKMFKKYGYEKPIWSTELGLNSQGMARHSVAGELYRKTANFFAGGGANMSWFGLFYPDPDAKIHDSFGSAHNVFDCRYSKYAPKLDAIAYYNAVNSLTVKKYVEDKIYADGTQFFLFRDGAGNALQIIYRDNGREDIFIPLPGVEEVTMIKIDGSIKKLNAGKKGISFSVSEDPLLLLYQGGETVLPKVLEKPDFFLSAIPESVVAGEKTQFDVVINDIPEERIGIRLPPFWTEQHAGLTDEQGRKVIRYTFQIPAQSTVREADVAAFLKDDANQIVGELSYRSPVTGALSLEILPMPLVEGENPSVKLIVRNNSSAKQKLVWNIELYGEQRLVEGLFSEVERSSAYFTGTPSGKLELKENASKEIILPLMNINLYKVYKMKASVRDQLGRVVEQDRPVSAFYGVPKVKKSLVMDGLLNEEEWGRAPVRTIGDQDAFWAFIVKDWPAVPTWEGKDDLSADIRFLWDDRFLYVSLDVTDDIAGPIAQADAELWRLDGLQFLIDPMRRSKYKVGKYDYSIAEGTKGIQTWCALTASSGLAPTGNVPDIQVAMKRAGNGRGDVVYEMAIPWYRLAPFKPEAGGNLGFTLIVNEDDGYGRDSYLMWFGNASSKDVDTVGDLILLD